MTSRLIPAVNMTRLQDEITKFNRKAEKLGCKPMELVIGERIERRMTCEITLLDYTWVGYECAIKGETPVLDGWKLIARVTPQDSGENLIKCVPGEECPPQYRNANPFHCDHCHTSRRRNDVFILQHEDGRTVQVGRQCIADYLGNVSAAGLLSYAEYGWGILEVLAEAQGESWGKHIEPFVYITRFIAACSVCYRRLGWVSSSRAREGYGEQTATCWSAWELCNPPIGAAFADWERWVKNNELYQEYKDTELAEKALAWGRSLPTEGVSDYLYNLGVACRLETVKRDTVGIMASLIATYQREKERNLERESNACKVRGHVGAVNQRLGFPALTVKNLKTFDSMYGVRTLVRFEDENGNIIVWWASGEPEWAYDAYEADSPIDITATVKEHGSYKGISQTVVQRVREGLPKTKKQHT